MIDAKSIIELPVSAQLEKKIEVINKHELIEIPSILLPEVFSDKYYFISYSHLDFRLVYKDLFYLQNEGVNTWYDRGIPVGKNWKDIANKYMSPRNCLGIIMYVSENSLKSAAVLNEISYATKVNKPFICIVLPFENDYLYEGEHTVGKMFSPLKMIEILDRNNQLSSNVNADILKRFFSDETIYLKYSEDIFTKKEKIELSLKETPLLHMNKTENLSEEDLLELSNIDDGTPGFVVDDLFDNSITSIKEKDFVDCGYTELDEDFTPIYVGFSVFSHCTFLESVSLPKSSVLSLGSYAFYNDYSLLNLNSRLCYVGDYAFADCTKLEDIGMNHLTYVGNKGFYNCFNLKTKITLNGGVGYKGFFNCHNLIKVDQLVIGGEGDIGALAFGNCYKLKEIDLIRNISNIRDRAFLNCRSLRFFKLPDCVDFISETAFLGCEKLEQFIIDETNGKYCVKSGVLYGSGGSKLCIVPQNYKGKVMIGKDVEKISEYAFAYSNGKYSVEVDLDNKHFMSVNGSLFSLDGKVLYYLNPSLKCVIPDGVEVIAPFALSGFKEIKKCIIPESIKEIQKYAFAGVKLINKLQLLDWIDIDERAFDNVGINFLEITSNKESLNQTNLPSAKECRVFGCKSISVSINAETLYIADDVECIEYLDFSGETLYLGQSISKINKFICSSLLNVICDKNHSFKFEKGMLLSKNGKILFYVRGDKKKVVIPEGVVLVSSFAFCKSQVTKVVFPETILMLDTNSFYECLNLKGIILNEHIKIIGLNALECPSIKKKFLNGTYYYPTSSNPYYFAPRVFVFENGIHPDIRVIGECIIESTSKVVIPEGIICISKISNHFALTEIGVNDIVFPNSLKYVKSDAFDSLAMTSELRDLVQYNFEHKWTKF